MKKLYKPGEEIFLSSKFISEFISYCKLKSKRLSLLDLGSADGWFLKVLDDNLKLDVSLFGLELQYDLYLKALAKVKAFKNKVKFIFGDIRSAFKYFDYSCFDFIFANPPFYPFYPKLKNKMSFSRLLARTDYTVKLSEIFSACVYLSRFYFFVVYPKVFLDKLFCIYYKNDFFKIAHPFIIKLLNNKLSLTVFKVVKLQYN